MHLYDYDQGYGRDRRTSLVAPNADTNSCLEGSVIGGLLALAWALHCPGQRPLDRRPRGVRPVP